MKISKKLSVLVGTAGIWFLQQQGIDATAIVDQVIVTPLSNMTDRANDSSDDLIYYISGVYIAVQGIIDTVQTWMTKEKIIDIVSD